MTQQTPDTLPWPSHFDPAQAGEHSFAPDAQTLLEAAYRWRRQHGLKPAGSDRGRLHLLLIDVQKDFCFPEGSLFVGGRSGRGAVQDSERTARFVYENLHRISEITCTMDSHFPHQIFFPSFWIDEDGNPPPPHTLVTTAELSAGRLRPNPAVAAWLCSGNYAWLTRQVAFYCAELERAGKYTLYLWPPHCLLGSEGHALAGVLQEARLFHAYARGARNAVEIKGGHALTENYSVLAPEVLVRHDGRPLAQRNVQFLETLLAADAVVVAGQAASHCVKSTIDDLLEQARAEDPELVRKVYVLADAMSAVAVPDGKGGWAADFTDEAEAALARYQEAGMHVVRTDQPLQSWPELAGRLRL